MKRVAEGLHNRGCNGTQTRRIRPRECHHTNLPSFVVRFALFARLSQDPDSPNREISFQWKRNRLFDHVCALALYRSTLQARKARVLGTDGRNQNKWRPTPLATVELQKRASKYHRLASEVTMDAAEKVRTDKERQEHDNS